LSYGLQRRLEIARALCINPKLICLDEPAAGLNPNETADLSELILKIRRDFKVTVFVIEHDMSMVMKISDHIVVLDHGQVIARGTPLEVKSNRAVISAYLGEEE
jgi:branched-chain amino acid transport system ATP-binding protein